MACYNDKYKIIISEIYLNFRILNCKCKLNKILTHNISQLA